MNGVSMSGDCASMLCPEKTCYGAMCHLMCADVITSVHTIAPRVATADYVKRKINSDMTAVRRCSTYSSIANILGVFTYNVNVDQPLKLCVITENFEVGTVRDVLDANPGMTRDARAVLMLGVASSLKVLHGATGALHRNVRSSSFMVTPHGSVKLVTTELSKHTACHRKSRKSAVVATAYMSPQLLNNNFMRYRASDEVYSLGIVFWEIVTGNDPFAGMSSAEIVRAVLNGAREPLGSDCPSYVADLIDACRAYVPGNRPPVSEVADTLRLVCGAVWV